MEARRHHDPAEFRAQVEPLLATDPIRNTVALTAVRQLAENPDADPDVVMLTLWDNNKLIGTALRTPPYPLIVNAVPLDAMSVTVAELHDMAPLLPAISGPLDAIGAFAEAWTELTGATSHTKLAMRLFRLDTLRPPTVPGHARAATDDDLDLLVTWRVLFIREALPRTTIQQEDVRAELLETVRTGAVHLLWMDDDQIVSYAAASAPTAGMCRVAPVYTPPEFRGRGYGSAATAAATQWALDHGVSDVLLTTDLANLTTNRIYPRLGYRPILDLAEIEFRYPA